MALNSFLFLIAINLVTKALLWYKGKCKTSCFRSHNRHYYYPCKQHADNINNMIVCIYKHVWVYKLRGRAHTFSPIIFSIKQGNFIALYHVFFTLSHLKWQDTNMINDLSCFASTNETAESWSRNLACYFRTKIGKFLYINMMQFMKLYVQRNVLTNRYASLHYFIWYQKISEKRSRGINIYSFY